MRYAFANFFKVPGFDIGRHGDTRPENHGGYTGRDQTSSNLSVAGAGWRESAVILW